MANETASVKRCVACAEEILLEAKLCKYCDTIQPSVGRNEQITAELGEPRGVEHADLSPRKHGGQFVAFIGVVIVLVVAAIMWKSSSSTQTARPTPTASSATYFQHDVEACVNYSNVDLTKMYKSSNVNSASGYAAFSKKWAKRVTNIFENVSNAELRTAVAGYTLSLKVAVTTSGSTSRKWFRVFRGNEAKLNALCTDARR